MKIYSAKEAEDVFTHLLNEHYHDFWNGEKCCGYFKSGSSWLAFDNTTGDCWTEVFDTEEEAIRWIKREGEVQE